MTPLESQHGHHILWHCSFNAPCNENSNAFGCVYIVGCTSLILRGQHTSRAFSLLSLPTLLSHFYLACQVVTFAQGLLSGSLLTFSFFLLLRLLKLATFSVPLLPSTPVDGFLTGLPPFVSRTISTSLAVTMAVHTVAAALILSTARAVVEGLFFRAWLFDEIERDTSSLEAATYVAVLFAVVHW